MPRTHAGDAVLAVALEHQGVGAHFAGAYVDTDGTATIELLERLVAGWFNLTTDTHMTSLDMAAKYDDVVITRFAKGWHDCPCAICATVPQPSGQESADG